MPKPWKKEQRRRKPLSPKVLWASCWRKRRFTSKANALEAAPGLRAYECPNCGGWHLTKKGADDA